MIDVWGVERYDLVRKSVESSATRGAIKLTHKVAGEIHPAALPGKGRAAFASPAFGEAKSFGTKFRSGHPTAWRTGPQHEASPSSAAIKLRTNPANPGHTARVVSNKVVRPWKGAHW